MTTSQRSWLTGGVWPWTPASGVKAAHPNARFTTPAASARSSPRMGRPQGRAHQRVPLGGRRKTVVPLVNEALDWEHGVFLGATMASETTAANLAEVGKLRFDPFAMLPSAAITWRLFKHWLKIGKGLRQTAPYRFLTSTGSGGAKTVISCGLDSATTAACWNGCSTAATMRRPPARRRLDTSRGTLNVKGLDIPASDLMICLKSMQDGKPWCRKSKSISPSSATAACRNDAAAGKALKARLG